ncbi:MAG: glycoside hydrolase family 127 protein, partial [Anaerolineaceae bacterium]|nr:glycoside hydrolase family 127 protein [Anaerolineaceae bacterium]
MFMPTTKRQLKPVPFTQVRFDDAFWAPRIETNRKVTLRHIYKKLQETGRISAFDLNFEREVPSPVVLIFGDSDPAKWIEAASYSLATHPDPELEEMVNQVTEKIISAQQPDGYLNTHFTHIQPEMRWKNLRDWHEMYCAGHMIEGAVAHFQATGQRRFLDALCRYADHIDNTFGPEEGKQRGYPGHPELELALVRLYHATGNQRYLDLASYMVEERGQVTPEHPHYFDVEAIARGEDPRRFWARSYEYNQSHAPIREQEKVVGHAVRATYLFSAVADLADEKDDASLLEACNRLWDNLTNRRMYLTGGIGPSQQNEGFTSDYDLPDETAYAETCATIALVMWNLRLLQFAGERRFADVLERGLFNGLISGISLAGDRYLYENPLSTNGTRHRQEWFLCPCCPPNLSRTVASVGKFLYSTSAGAIWTHLFAGSTAQMDVPLG